MKALATHAVLSFTDNTDGVTLWSDMCSETLCPGSGGCLEKVDMLEMRQQSGSQII